MKFVRDTAAGKSISALIVLNSKGAHVATVNVHYANSGRVSVDVWNLGDSACARSAETALKTGAVTPEKLAQTVTIAPDYFVTDEDRTSWAAHKLFGLQQATAGGYGYDKLASALSGMIIDGHTLANHCGRVPEAEKARAQILKAHHSDPSNSKVAEAKAAKIGARFANWSDGRWTGLHFIAGLDRLTALGYRVIQAI